MTLALRFDIDATVGTSNLFAVEAEATLGSWAELTDGC
jgi:hypothetical protein